MVEKVLLLLLFGEGHGSDGSLRPGYGDQRIACYYETGERTNVCSLAVKRRVSTVGSTCESLCVPSG